MHFKYTEEGSYLLGKTAWYKKITSAIRNSKREYYRNAFQKLWNDLDKTWPSIASVFQAAQNKNAI